MVLLAKAGTPSRRTATAHELALQVVVARHRAASPLTFRPCRVRWPGFHPCGRPGPRSAPALMALSGVIAARMRVGSMFSVTGSHIHPAPGRRPGMHHFHGGTGRRSQRVENLITVVLGPTCPNQAQGQVQAHLIAELTAMDYRPFPPRE